MPTREYSFTRTAASCRRRPLTIGFALLAMSLAPAALAQFPPGPPPNAIDLGDIGIPAQTQSPDVPLMPGGIVWFKFRLLEPITRRDSWLDIDTAGPNVVGNNMIVLYNDRAIRVSCDNDDGGGTGSADFGRGWSGALTYGCGNGARISGNDPNWGGGAISDGRDGWLTPGVYYLGIIGWISGFDHCGDWISPNPSWGYNTSSTISGLVRCRLSTGRAVPTLWNETRNEAGDGGGAPDFASVIFGNGPLQTILGNFGEGERDVFKFRICDPVRFRVSALLQATDQFEGYTRPARLFLFDETGRGVVAINSTITNAETILTAPADLDPGDYYLAVGTHCGGLNGYDSVPYDALNQRLWDFSSSSNWNNPIPPNGPGAANPMLYFGPQSDCHSNFDRYHFRLAMQGACYIPRGSECVADLDGNGEVTLQDLAIMLARFGTSCP